MLRKAIAGLSRPLSRLLLRTVSLPDPWQRFASPVPLHRYGIGAQQDFPWYFEGPSNVTVSSLEDVRTWLLTCEYARDPDLFQKRDFWQHPRTFEHLRRGDCEDFALWTWRKLVELGYEAELIAGQWQEVSEGWSPHAWVVFHKPDGPYLFDAVIRSHRHMVRPLQEVQAQYLPEVSVDGRFTRYAYGGYLYRLRLAQARPSA